MAKEADVNIADRNDGNFDVQGRRHVRLTEPRAATEKHASEGPEKANSKGRKADQSGRLGGLEELGG